MMRFQVFLSLWSVTSWLCIDKIPEVAKTEVSKPKRYSLSKSRLCQAPLKTSTSNTPPHVYVTMLKYLCNAAKMSRKERRRGFSDRSSVDAAVSGRLCVFLYESKSTLFGLPKVDAFRNHWLRLVYNTTAQPKCSNFCNAFYGWQFCDPRRVPRLAVKAISIIIINK